MGHFYTGAISILPCVFRGRALNECHTYGMIGTLEYEYMSILEKLPRHGDAWIVRGHRRQIRSEMISSVGTPFTKLSSSRALPPRL